MPLLVDLLLLAFVGAYAFRGYHRGVIRESFDLFGFTLGAVAALRFHRVTGAPFRWLGVSDGWSSFIGGLLIFAPMIVLSALAARRTLRAPRFGGPLTRGNRTAGAAVASVWAAGFALFFLVLLLVLPAPQVMAPVNRSVVGHTVLRSGSPVYTALENLAEGDARNLIIYLRQYFDQLRPSTSSPDAFLRIRASQDIALGEGAERAVLDLVNRERAQRGLPLLRIHEEIREVARSHSADMYRRGYFAHVNPDGLDPFDRIRAGGVDFAFAGENLALAPNVELVHQGLMNSPRHRDNILKEDFTDLGVGIYEGPSGLMVTQNFCAGCRDR